VCLKFLFCKNCQTNCRQSGSSSRHTPLRAGLRSRPAHRSPLETHRAAWLQPSPPAALSNCTPFPPTPPPLGTPIAARDTVADRHGGRHLPRDRGEASEDAKCPPTHETRRQTCALRAQSGDRNEPAHGKKKREWLCIEWVIIRYSGQSALPPPATSRRRPRVGRGKGPCWWSPCVDKLHGGR